MEEMVEDDSVIFREFMRVFRGNEERFIFFLEGVDDLDYYYQSFDKYIWARKEKWMELICHGRKNVINLISSLKQHSKLQYSNALCFGFIDKDYYEVHNNKFVDDIYVTPVYSIENFYVSSKFMGKVLERKFYLNENENDDFNTCLNNYLMRKHEFVDKIKDLDCYLRCNRIMFEDKKINSKINARNINLANNITVGLDKVTFKVGSLDMLGKVVEDFDEDSLRKAEEFYRDKSHSELALLIRGKFMFYFIHHYLHRLRIDNLQAKPTLFPDSYKKSKLKKPEKIPFKKTNISVNVERQDIISDLSMLSDIPECLVEFLRMIIRRRAGVTQNLISF